MVGQRSLRKPGFIIHSSCDPSCRCCLFIYLLTQDWPLTITAGINITLYMWWVACSSSRVNHVEPPAMLTQCFNSLRPRLNRRHFADDIFKCIFLNENVWISLQISLKFVPKGPINNIPALVQIMAWRRPGDKPLSEPMMVSLPTRICVTRPQWVNVKCQYQATMG